MHCKLAKTCLGCVINTKIFRLQVRKYGGFFKLNAYFFVFLLILFSLPLSKGNKMDRQFEYTCHTYCMNFILFFWDMKNIFIHA